MPSYDPSLFNVDPYYDDFSEDKKFLRLMFRPGYGVQARELTQLQTILQNQVERLGSHIFEEGSIVLDGQISENRLKYSRISANTTEISDFIGVVMSGPFTSARVVHAEPGLDSNADSNPVLFFEYMDGGTGFTFNDIISGTAGNGAGITATITGPSFFTNPVGNAIVVSVDRGVRFVEGYFVLNTAQSIGAHSISGSGSSRVRIFDNPTTRLGFIVNKEFVTASEDQSLNDPAFGYYNYAAPGSDRFTIDLGLTQYGYTASDTSAVDNFSRVGFVEFMRIVDGDVVKVEKYPDYAMLEDTLARRTYDESGNYTVVPFELDLAGPTTVSGNEVLKAELSAGKAYVFGYEFETQSKTKLNLPCARGESHERAVTRDFTRSVGPKTKVRFSGISGSFGSTADFSRHPIAFLSSGESGDPYNKLGTARLRGVEPYLGSDYYLNLYDVNLVTGDFSDVRRVFVGQTASHAFTITGSAGLENESQSSLLYRVPDGSVVKEFNQGNYAIVAYDSAVVSSMPFTFTITDPNLYFATRQLGVSYPLPDKDIFIFDQDGSVVGGTAARGNTDYQLSITVNSGTSVGKKLNIIVTKEPDNFNESMTDYLKEKTVVTENITLTGAWGSALTGDERGSTSDILYLNGLVDVIQVLALTGSKGESSGIDLLPHFTLDNGQRDALYDWSRMVLVPGTTAVTGPYTATIKRYSRSGSSAGIFTVSSYPDFEDIPSYTSRSTGEIFSLRDCIDFRPDRSLSGDTVPTSWIPSNTPANDNIFSYTHYLPRTDKIVITRDRKFSVLTGIPSLDALAPEDNPNAMSIYTVTLNPFTFSSDDASIRYVENKRYTMRDIGDLEKRIQAVEYYTTLNLLEQDAKAKSVRDENGDEMPKRGILVDQFKGHAIGDTEDPMYSASIDDVNNEVRPAIDTRSYELVMRDVSPLTNVTGNADDGVYTLNYTENAEISHLLASDWTQINPSTIINYMGTMALSPSTDVWFDDKAQPKVKVNVEGENNNFLWHFKTKEQRKNSSSWRGAYNSWESRWFGSPIQNAKNTRPNIKTIQPARANASGININSIQSSTIPESISKIVSNKKVNKDVLAPARAKNIRIHAKGLKPNTRFNVFCDDMKVNAFCIGEPITDSKGEVGLTFGFNFPINNPEYTGPAQNFLVGRHRIRIVDSDNIEDPSTWTMSAEATYMVEGAFNSVVESGQLSTRLGDIRRKSVKSEKVISNLNEILTSSGDIRGYDDPLSQTFYVDPSVYPSGFFVKSIDLYFKEVETLSTIPVTVQIRPTISGYPHPSKVLPFATAVRYSNEMETGDIVQSGDENRTNFAFSSPVYLLPGQEYAICVSSNSPVYSVFIGGAGSTVLRDSEESPKYPVTKQPFVRSLFRPHNTGKLTKNDNESLVFRLNVCHFVNSGIIVLQNDGITGIDPVLNTNEFRFNTPEMIPEGASVSYSAELRNTIPSSDTDYSNILPNKNIHAIRGVHTVTNSNEKDSVAELSVSMSSGAKNYVSPVFDLERSSLLTVSNQINNKFVSDPSSPIYNGELEPTNSGVLPEKRAVSRYITKKVTLEPGMEAENITVMMSLCNSRGASNLVPSVKVFVRPISVGETDYDMVGYIELATSDTGVSTSNDEFREVTYTNIGNGSLPKFRTFSVKVAMFGDDNGASVPRIRNLRIIAT